MKECTICKAGTTRVLNPTEKLMVGGVRMYYIIEHWCAPIDGINFRTTSFYGRTEEEVLDIWNSSLAAIEEELPDVTNGR